MQVLLAPNSRIKRNSDEAVLARAGECLSRVEKLRWRQNC